MTREKFMLDLSLKLLDVPEGEMTRDTVRKIDFEYRELYARALEDAPCAHDGEQNYVVNVNGQRIERCGICCRDMGVLNG